MNSKQIFIFFLVVALVGEEVSAHTPLSVIKWIGHWTTKPLVALSHLPIAHFATKAVVAKKLALAKAGLVAKPLLLKAAVVGAITHHGKVFGARTTPASNARTTRLPLIRRMLPQRVNLPEVIVPVRLSIENSKTTQNRISQETIPTKV